MATNARIFLTMEQLVEMMDDCGTIEIMGDDGKLKRKHYIEYEEVKKLHRQLKNGECWAWAESDCVSIGNWIKEERRYPKSNHKVQHLCVDELLAIAKRDKINLAKKKMGDKIKYEELEKTIPPGYPLYKGYNILKDTGVTVESKDTGVAVESKTMKNQDKKKKKKRVFIQGYGKLDLHDEAAMERALEDHPFTAGMLVDNDFFDLKDEIYIHKKIPVNVKDILKETEILMAERRKLKESGVDPGPLPRTIMGMHAVLVVGSGYDPVQDLKFWVVKNTYGRGWGIEGFGRVLKQSSTEDGSVPSFVSAFRPYL